MAGRAIIHFRIDPETPWTTVFFFLIPAFYDNYRGGRPNSASE